MSRSSETERTPFFAPLPTRGPWTALGLSRGPFFAILAAACLVYLFWGGAVWSDVGESEFARIVVSYAVIPLGAAIALRREGHLSWAALLAASGVIAVSKLLLTAGFALLLDLIAR
ncbi:MAG: hypothetical protein FJ144_14375 [Deltaproteobacteria bacterium]|nr:hypothetical protein [Deltaproteobacteria bacterium]